MKFLQLWFDLWGGDRAVPRLATRLPRAESRHASPTSMRLWKNNFQVEIVRSIRARRYQLRWRVEADCARLTLPKRGSLAAGMLFLEQNEAWVLRQRGKAHVQTFAPRPWSVGRELFWRGEAMVLREVGESDGRVTLVLGIDLFGPTREEEDYRSFLEAALRWQAARELPARTAHLAALHGITYSRVVVRAQRRRWGSCSGRGTVSLNWRLLQVPPSVCDYIILHELAHRRQMNHSARFWALVARLDPGWRAAEAWLREHPISKLTA